MKPYIINSVTILLAISSFLLGKEVIPLLMHGITVKYQRVTGPEFIVLKGEKYLKSIYSNDTNIDCSELYVYNSNDLDSDQGFLSSKCNYIVDGDYKKKKAIFKNDQLYPVIYMKKILTESGYFVYLALFLLCFIWFFVNALVLVKNHVKI